MRRIDLRGTTAETTELAAVMPRAALDTAGAVEVVAPIVELVRTEGAPVLYELAERFDHVRPRRLRVPAAALTAALDGLDPDVRAALEVAIAHARTGHTQQLPAPSSVEVVPGGRITQRWVPVERVGLYVPGGLAVYPSSVVMNVVCAQVAGVASIALASPPQADFGGLPHPTILAACALLGVDEVWAIGGAQAIAALAHGLTDEGEVLRPVDVVTGPGNIYVAAAKRVVQGKVGIDAEAGTTEIAVLADDSADARFVAADLVSQAEHDPAAASVLVTDSADLADRVDALVREQAYATVHTQRILTALEGPQSGIVLVDDMEQGLAVVDAYAAEHLEVQTRDAAGVAARVRNAGAVFVGPWTPVPLGDYVAGSNHVLPTGGTARFASGLNVTQYLRSQQVVEYSEDALAGLAGHLDRLARAEDLPAHGAAALVRQGKGSAS
ncbi:histidinol dehydrogenase [Schaalia sp. 19OD2882]|uniref:histidinol dehydrogenase n=1 Tax=Schaalia sp. 19OD2882 TaxID=2794089 RepID=UPI001C1EA79F|nr:histidinol dehydrogenase [Schaalia sp. 19OD2882]QWW18927.1 histidinol dehydrogenase [Schaalia sp. 19OD2882]